MGCYGSGYIYSDGMNLFEERDVPGENRCFYSLTVSHILILEPTFWMVQKNRLFKSNTAPMCWVAYEFQLP